MKKMSLALVLVSVCASYGMSVSAEEGGPLSEVSGKETSGVILEKETVRLSALNIEAVSPNAKFTKIVPILPGEDMRKEYQPAEIVPNEDLIIGVGGQTLWTSSGALLSAVGNAYGKNPFKTVQVLKWPGGNVENILIGNGNSPGDLSLSASSTEYSCIKIASVVPGSWAERSGLRAGDEFIGKTEFQSAIIRRSRLPFLTYSRNKKTTQIASSGDVSAVAKFFDDMFRDINPYRPTKENKDGLMGEATLLRVSLVRDLALIHKDLVRSRNIGLGAGFNCLPTCGATEPVVTWVAENSAAARAGLKVGDLITSINGKSVYRTWETVQKIRKLNYGDPITLRVIRGDRSGQLLDIATKIDWVIED